MTTQDHTMVLTLTVFGDGPDIGDIDLEHVVQVIAEGCHSGELCPSDGTRQGRGWWDYSEERPLCAAAPELLEACKELLAMLIWDNVDLGKYQAVVAKAEGGTS